MKTFVYAHKADCDGICSAAILKRYTDAAGAHGHIDFIDYGSLAEEAFSRITALESGSRVIIVDFGCDSKLMTAAENAILRLKERGGAVAWLDHHKWDGETVKRISAVADLKLSASDEMCGAELAYRNYMKDDEVSMCLAKLGRDSDIDMWKTNPPSPEYALTQPLADLITYYNYLAGDDNVKRRSLLLSIVDSLSTASPDSVLGKDFAHPFWDGALQKNFDKYKTLEKSKLEQCLDSAETFEAGGHTYVISFADRILSPTTAGNSLLNRYGTDASLVFRESGFISVRRNTGKDNIKCDEIAGLFGGGGHKYAAGAQLGHSLKTAEELESAKLHIIWTVKDYYSRR